MDFNVMLWGAEILVLPSSNTEVFTVNCKWTGVPWLIYDDTFTVSWIAKIIDRKDMKQTNLFSNLKTKNETSFRIAKQ